MKNNGGEFHQQFTIIVREILNNVEAIEHDMLEFCTQLRSIFRIEMFVLLANKLPKSNKGILTF